jgi:hypothetical protein
MAGTKGRCWIAATAAGILTILTAVWLSTQFPSDFAVQSPDFRDPIMAFEFAETEADVRMIFEADSTPAKAARQAAMDIGHDGDRYFLVIYSFFIIAFFTAYGKTTDQKLLYAGILIAIIAGGMDIWENAILRDLTYASGNLDGLLAALHSVTWVKWFTLAAGAGLSAHTLYKNQHPILAIISLPGFLLAIPAFFDPKGYATLFADGIGLWFLAMLIASILNWRRSTQEAVA